MPGIFVLGALRRFRPTGLNDASGVDVGVDVDMDVADTLHLDMVDVVGNLLLGMAAKLDAVGTAASLVVVGMAVSPCRFRGHRYRVEIVQGRSQCSGKILLRRALHVLRRHVHRVGCHLRAWQSWPSSGFALRQDRQAEL